MVKLSYVVSRFPNPTETFVMREMNQLAADGEFEIGLLSLFPPKRAFLHSSAGHWVERAYRPGPLASLIAFALYAVRRPATLARIVWRSLRATTGSRSHMVRTLATIPIACGCARRSESDGTAHLHAHFATYPALCAWICSQLTDASFSYTAHAHDIYVDDSLLRLTLADAAFVITISEFNRELLDGYGTGTPIEVIRAGIRPGDYPFKPRTVPAEGSVRAVCVASMKEHKGHEVLLEAIDCPELERLHLELIGDGDLRAELEADAARRGLGDRVEFRGSLDEAEVRDALEEADLFVMASRVARDGGMEGLPVALMEATASGLPIVATRLSAIPELISDGETAWLAEPDDAHSLRRALIRALGESGSLDLAEGRRRIEAEFDVAAGGERLGSMFAELASGRS